MIKQPEEGRIWEWRAFGRVSESLAAKICAYPTRLGVNDLRGEDIYLVSPSNDQNVKLRKYESGWVLKLKLLSQSVPGPFELYIESVALTHQLPIPLEVLNDAARLFHVGKDGKIGNGPMCWAFFLQIPWSCSSLATQSLHLRKFIPLAFSIG